MDCRTYRSPTGELAHLEHGRDLIEATLITLAPRSASRLRLPGHREGAPPARRPPHTRCSLLHAQPHRLGQVLDLGQDLLRLEPGILGLAYKGG